MYNVTRIALQTGRRGWVKLHNSLHVYILS